jgi:hypothetical protein
MGIPPQPYVRARLRRRQQLGWGITARATPSVFWDREDRFGAAAGLDFDRPLFWQILARWNNHCRLTQRSRGAEWSSDASLAREFTSVRIASAVGFGATGVTRPAPEVLLYRAYVRARRDLWRRWLFFELEPEIGWPNDPVLGRRQVLAATLRVEVHFDSRPPAADPGR